MYASTLVIVVAYKQHIPITVVVIIVAAIFHRQAMLRNEFM